MNKPNCVEIGRYQGGSTILMAYAGGKIFSIDLHVGKFVINGMGKRFDAYLHGILSLLGVRQNVKLKIGDSQNYFTDNLKETVDILFIDGDHRYEGVKKDYENWIKTVKPGGHVLFHDACKARPGATMVADVKRFVDTVPLKRVHEVGSVVHFIKEK